MDTKRKLLMSFKTSSDKTTSISVDDPRIDLTKVDIKTAMNLILDKNIFAFGGKDLASLVSAKVVETDTTVYELD